MSPQIAAKRIEQLLYGGVILASSAYERIIKNEGYIFPCVLQKDGSYLAKTTLIDGMYYYI